jgi:hypothetical protein
MSIRNRLFALALCLWATPGAVLLSSPAYAQQLLSSEALNGKLQDEINQDMQVREVLVQVKQELAKVNAHVKELEDKYEPKKPDEPKAEAK